MVPIDIDLPQYCSHYWLSRFKKHLFTRFRIDINQLATATMGMLYQQCGSLSGTCPCNA
jgi:hypothetical protein